MKFSSYMNKKSWLIIGVVFLLAFGLWSYNQKDVGFDPPVNDERCDECADVCDPCRDFIDICKILEDSCKDETKACDKLERECDYAHRRCPSNIDEYCNSDDVDEDECEAARALCELKETCGPLVTSCKSSVDECWITYRDCKDFQNDFCRDCGECMYNLGLDPYKDCLKKKVVEMR